MRASALHIYTFSFIFFCSISAKAQTQWLDSLKKTATTQKADTNKIWTLLTMSDYYVFNDPDSGILYAKQALALAEKLQFDKGIFWSIQRLDRCLYVTGNYTLELDYALRAFPIAKKLDDPNATGWSNGMLADSYLNLGDYNAAMPYVRIVLKSIERYVPDELYSGYAAIVPIYVGLHQYDSALISAKKSFELLKANPTLYNGNSLESKYAKGIVYLFLGEAFEANANYDSALFYYHLSVPISNDINTTINKIEAFNGMAKAYKEINNTDSAIWYAKGVLADKFTQSYPAGKLKAANLLADIYESIHNTDSSIKYLHMAVNLKDSLYNREKTTAFQNSLLKDQENQKEIMAATTALQSRYRTYFLIGLLLMSLVIAGIIIRNHRIKQVQKIRNSIADDLHDDIGSALSSISIMNELAKEKSPEAMQLLDSIGESASQMQENMSDIVWAIKAENDSFENLLQRMNRFASEILDAKDIALDFKTDASLAATKLTMEQRKNFYLFFKEAVNNAAKHSGAKKVNVCIIQKRHHIEIKIYDDGTGFDSAKSFSGNGMDTLKKRAAELNGTFKIISEVNDGTTVQLKFKIT